MWRQRLFGLPSAGNIEPRLGHLEKNETLALSLSGSRPVGAFLRILIVLSGRRHDASPRQSDQSSNTLIVAVLEHFRAALRCRFANVV